MNLADAPINQTYVERANALDSTGQDSTAARYRMTPGLIKYLAAVSNALMSIGESVDGIKKHIFYGKQLAIPLLPPLEFSMRVAQGRLDQHENVRVLHATLGLITESIEMHTRVMEYLLGQIDTLDNENLEEEGGDQLWYLSLIVKHLGHFTFDPLMMGNIAKLETRYGGTKWNQEGALNRDTNAEMVAMKGRETFHPDVASQLDPATIQAINEMEGQSDDILRGSEKTGNESSASEPVGVPVPSEENDPVQSGSTDGEV